MVAGTLAIVHDGSYMKEVNPHVCSAAYMIWCCATGLRAKGTMAEWSDLADSPLFPNYASVHPLNNDTVALHSLAPPPVWLQPTTNFWAVLRGYDNQSLWDNFDCDGDGS